MKKFLPVWIFIFGAIVITGCQSPNPVEKDALRTIDQKLVTFPRFPEAHIAGKIQPIIPLSNSTFVVLTDSNNPGITVQDEIAQFELSALELQLEFWSIRDQSFTPVIGAKKITTIGDAVHFFAQQKIHPLTVTGELSDYLLLKLNDTHFSPDLIGIPVFNPEGHIIGLIHSFDIQTQQLKVLKWSVIQSFWDENNS